MEENNKYIPFAKTVDMKTKQKIWYLYFEKMCSYKELEARFKKYNYAQLKSIINERYKNYGKAN